LKAKRFFRRHLKTPAYILAGFFVLGFSTGDGGKKNDEDKKQGPAVLKFGHVDDWVTGADKAQRKVGNGHIQRICTSRSGESEQEPIEFSVFDGVQLEKLHQIRWAQLVNNSRIFEKWIICSI
jgi:hypothetical protein